MTKQSTAQFVEATAEARTHKARLDDAMMIYRAADHRLNSLRRQVELAEREEADTTTATKALSRAVNALAEVPEGVLERLRGHLASDAGGRSGQRFSTVVPGPTVTTMLDALLTDARTHSERATAKLAALRERLARAEAELAPLAARVEELRAQVAA